MPFCSEITGASVVNYYRCSLRRVYWAVASIEHLLGVVLGPVQQLTNVGRHTANTASVTCVLIEAGVHAHYFAP